uniref:Uncharacterized protein n=1 Tax=Globisporangium ultimum (strain ATCC 200006 / CBS 805.95 / DAOM BR144) TaxID=431595 RepID=K3XDB7_GLOUD
MYENWDKCIKSLQARLYLAKMKTHSVSQRAAIAHAIIIPKAIDLYGGHDKGDLPEHGSQRNIRNCPNTKEGSLCQTSGRSYSH